MKKQAFNPFLPSMEYVPDGEPKLFGDRVYLYGSHDSFNARIFCTKDYVCYSAPKDDLSNWRYEGVIFHKKDDPKNRLGLRLLFAPDVVQGKDGLFYLYYAFDFMGIMGVAVSETPSGPFRFLGHVHHRDGKIWGRRKGDSFPFDPGVLVDDDGEVYLYSGFYTEVPPAATGFVKLRNDGGVVLKLESDMVTIKEEEKLLFPKKGKGSFMGHEFFEASSIRKYDGKYYFVYSSVHNHELCYAVSTRPDSGFVFGGTLVDIGDVYLDGHSDEKDAVNYLGNTHGGMLKVNDDWYIFYHRQTNRHSYSRQACAEKLTVNKDGSIRQSEVTSCGLNGKALNGSGRYEARIACNLWSKNGCGRYDCKNPRKVFKEHPYFTQRKLPLQTTLMSSLGLSEKELKKITERRIQYIANMKDGSVAGFKYFDFMDTVCIRVEITGSAKGTFFVSEVKDFSVHNADIMIDIDSPDMIQTYGAHLRIEDGVKPLYFKFEGEGYIDFISFSIDKSGR